jgi:hypothetical protein
VGSQSADTIKLNFRFRSVQERQTGARGGIGPARERIVRPVDRPGRDQIPHQLLWIEAEDSGERGEPCVDQFMLSEVGHRFRLRPPEPAREYRVLRRVLRPPDRNPRIR